MDIGIPRLLVSRGKDARARARDRIIPPSLAAIRATASPAVPVEQRSGNKSHEGTPQKLHISLISLAGRRALINAE